MPEISLKPMSSAYFQIWKEQAQRSFAEDKARTHGYAPEQALLLATEAFASNLPENEKTPDHHLSTVHDQEGAQIGVAWLAVQEDYGIRRAFIYEIEINRDKRGQGYGKILMKALEEQARSLEATCMNLHVFSYNELAQKLYRSLGYQVTDISMEKRL